MSYIDAILEREKNQIQVIERDRSGKRRIVSHPTKYCAYWPDSRGKYTSIKGTKLAGVTATRKELLNREISGVRSNELYENDINATFRCLYDNYRGTTLENLHIGFFDIEVDFDPVRGFSSTEEAFAPVTAISVYMSWLKRNYTLVIKPKTLTFDQAQEIVDEFEDTILCENEKQLLQMFLEMIDDVDVLSGWNSEGYDIPYLHNRIIQVLGKDETRKLCLCGKFPVKREYESYGRKQVTWDLVGRVHLDYLQLYRKHTYHEMHSYRLDFVGEYEVNEHKTHYEGTLDQLYNNDFKRFIEYNKQDVLLLVKIDAKLKFIDLASTLAHENTVLFNTTMGAVALIDQAIVNAAWADNLRVPAKDRTEDRRRAKNDDDDDEEESHGVAGAYVAHPKTGLHDWIGSMDINSLYPSAIRALNMSPETIVGQIRLDATDALILSRMTNDKMSFSDAWGDMFGVLEYTWVMEKSQNPVTIDFEDGSDITVPAIDVYKLIFESNKNYVLSANGTIFDKSKPGVIPGVLNRWYAERKQLQAEAKKYAKLAEESKDDTEKYEEYKRLAAFYDQRQLIKKILLNSLYGAIDNAGSRWYDPRVAQSITLTGRCIARHMQAKCNEVITGYYDNLGDSIVYGDSVTGDTLIRTDSGEITIETLFNQCPGFMRQNGKEYGTQNEAKVVGFNAYEDTPIMSNISYVMRHKTKKKIYQITTECGKVIKVTEDHSLMIDRDGFLLDVSPLELQDGDLIIRLTHLQ